MLVLLLQFLLLYTVSGTETPVVSTHLGKIRGHYKKSFNQRTYAAFEGIPYAKPPIGTRRFEVPEPIEKWIGIWDASYLYECPQTHETITGSEDCLYLNVYVPRTHIDPSESLDVVVHIHGGGFYECSGHSYAFPGYLMDEDIIFVTFNYRLGVLGFLSTEDEVVPGNNGMKDQVLALKWVQNNIASFGGNPNSVTITGASAGGVSVQYHYLSPMSQGLFHRGLANSGSTLIAAVVQRGALDKAKILGTTLGCPTTSTKDLVNCLKQRPVQQLLKHTDLFHGYRKYPGVAFAPVVEKGPNSFLPQEPLTLLQEKKIQDLPFVASFVQHEAGFKFPDFSTIEGFNKDWKEAAPYVLNYNYTVPKEKWGTIAEKVLEFYLGQGEGISRENFEKFVKMNTDGWMVHPIVKAADLQARGTTAPVYVYELSYTGSAKTVVHSNDNQYFFFDSTKVPTEDELKMKDVMVDMLVAYAKTGTPTIDGVAWKPVTSEEFHFLNISGFEREKMVLENDRNVGNGEFWDSLGL